MAAGQLGVLLHAIPPAGRRARRRGNVQPPRVLPPAWFGWQCQWRAGFSDFSRNGIELAPQQWPNVSISNDGRWLLVDVSEGWTKTELYLKDFSKKELSAMNLAMPQGRFQRITS